MNMNMNNCQFINRLKARTKRLKKEISVVYFVYQHEELPLLPKLLVLLTLGYALSPIDLIPDFIPVLGYLDDLILIPALISLSIKLIPPDIIRDARQRVKTELPSLKISKVIAVIFILIWIFILIVMIIAIIGLISKIDGADIENIHIDP